MRPAVFTLKKIKQKILFNKIYLFILFNRDITQISQWRGAPGGLVVNGLRVGSPD